MCWATFRGAGHEADAQYAQDLHDDMDALQVTADSQRMNPSVRSVLAIPMLSPDRKHTFAVLYADSTSVNAFDASCLSMLASMCKSFASTVGNINFDRVANFPIATVASIPQIGPEVIARLRVIRTVESPEAPSAESATYLNVEFTDFIVGAKS